MHIFFVIALFATWSLSFPLGKWLLQYSSPVFVTGVRMTLAGIILLLWLALRRQLPSRLSWKQCLALLILALFGIYLANILEFWSLHRISAAKTCFFYSLSPFFTAILSYFHFNEKITPMKLLGLSVGSLGFIPALLEKASLQELTQGWLCFSWPELAIAGAAFFSVYGAIAFRMIVKNEHLSPAFANGFSMTLGGSLALITALIGNKSSLISQGDLPTFAALTCILILLSNIFCYNLYGFLLRRYTATLLSFFGLLSPLFTSLHEWVILGQPPSLHILTASSIVILGLWLFYREELLQGYVRNNIKG